MHKISPSRSQLSEVGEGGGFGIQDAERSAKLVLTASKRRKEANGTNRGTDGRRIYAARY